MTDERVRSTCGAMLILVGLTGAAACAPIARAAFASPVVTLRDVRLSAIGVEGGTLDVILSVYNPNDFNLDASRITYAVSVDSAMVGQGAADERVVVPARDTAAVRLPVRFTWAGAGAAGRELMSTGAVSYRVTGEMKIASGMGTITLPYNQRGRFSAAGSP